jgi:hypothetical protein
VKKLAGDKRFSHVRELDPGNPKSAKKPFFIANILAEFRQTLHEGVMAGGSLSPLQGSESF